MAPVVVTAVTHHAAVGAGAFELRGRLRRRSDENRLATLAYRCACNTLDVQMRAVPIDVSIGLFAEFLLALPFVPDKDRILALLVVAVSCVDELLVTDPHPDFP